MSSKFLDKTGLDTFWAKIKSTFQTLGNLVTSWGSTPSDTKYPSEKLVKDALDGKVPGTTVSVSVPGSATRYVKMTVSYDYHHYLVFFNASMGVLHAEWLFRTYGSGGIARTLVNYIGATVSERKWYVAGADGLDYYIEFVNDSTSAQRLNFKVCALDISTLPTLSVVDTLPSGYSAMTIYGTVAEKLRVARNLAVDLSNTSTNTSFDGSANVTNIKTTGTLPVGNGGTGKASVTAGNYLVGNGTSALTEKTPKQVGNNVLPALDAGSDNVFDTDYIIASNHTSGATDATTFVRRTAGKLWNYIKSQISSVLGLTETSYGGNAATATKATQDSDGNAINATYFKSSGNTTLVAGAATKIGTQNGADVKLTLPAHQDISGKMATDCSNKASGALQNLTSQLDEGGSDFTDGTEMYTSYAGNSGFATTYYVNKPYRRKASSMWNYIKGKMTSDSGVNISGTATFATRALGFTINTYNNSTKRAQLGIATVDSSSREASMTCLVRLDSVGGPGGNGRNMSILVSLMCRGTERHLKAIILEDNDWNAYSASNKPVIVTFLSDSDTKLHVCLGVKNSSGTLIDFTYTKTRVLPLTECVNWTWTTATDSSTSYTYMFDCEYPRAGYADSAGSAGNADTVDGKHVVFGAYAGATDTIYFG